MEHHGENISITGERSIGQHCSSEVCLQTAGEDSLVGHEIS